MHQTEARRQFNLTTNSGLIRSVGHQNRVTQRSERTPDRDRLVGWSELLDSCQPLDRGNQALVRCHCVGLETSDRIQDCHRQVDRDLGPVGGADR
jgi:hypothetical protein